MSSLINNAMSGLNAAQAALNTASNNISSMIQQMKSISDKVSKTYSMNIDNLF